MAIRHLASSVVDSLSVSYYWRRQCSHSQPASPHDHSTKRQRRLDIVPGTRPPAPSTALIRGLAKRSSGTRDVRLGSRSSADVARHAQCRRECTEPTGSEQAGEPKAPRHLLLRRRYKDRVGQLRTPPRSEAAYAIPYRTIPHLSRFTELSIPSLGVAPESTPSSNPLQCRPKMRTV